MKAVMKKKNMFKKVKGIVIGLAIVSVLAAPVKEANSFIGGMASVAIGTYFLTLKDGWGDISSEDALSGILFASIGGGVAIAGGIMLAFPATWIAGIVLSEEGQLTIDGEVGKGQLTDMGFTPSQADRVVEELPKLVDMVINAAGEFVQKDNSIQTQEIEGRQVYEVEKFFLAQGASTPTEIMDLLNEIADEGEETFHLETFEYLAGEMGVR